MTFEHGYAVVIGVDANQLEGLALPMVANDVSAVYDVLTHPERCAYKPENVKLLKGQASTRSSILDALFWLNAKVRDDPDATAVIYYSGHGMEDRAANRYYLVPYDIPDLARIRSFAIAAETFNEEVASIQARRTLVVLDCCHAAGMAVKDVKETAARSPLSPAPFPIDLEGMEEIQAGETAPGTKSVSSGLLEGEGRAILNSSTGSQSSWTRSDGKMSIFTYHFIEALTGHAPHPEDAAVVYVTDIMSWVTHEVRKSAALEGVEQTPVMGTTGVFPVALLLGGQGIASSKGEVAPDPLSPLAPTTRSTQIGGDMVGGDKIEGDKITDVHISDVKGSRIQIGRTSNDGKTTGQKPGRSKK